MTYADSNQPGYFLLCQLRSFDSKRTHVEPSCALKKSIVCEGLANTLGSIAEGRARGESFSSIASALNKQGVRSKNGARLFPATVRAYLMQHSDLYGGGAQVPFESADDANDPSR